MAGNSLLKKFLNLPLLAPLREELSSLLFPRWSAAMLAELANIPVAFSGVEEIETQRTPFIVLRNHTKLYGMSPSELERKIYRRWKHKITPGVTEETIRVLIDAVLRYIYPHAMPHLVPPYPRAQRSFFHPQHKETIWDLPGWSDSQKKRLAEKFAIRPGEVYMDVGAYIGFGVIRMAQETGATGRVIAVEADPQASELLQRNVEANQLTNVTLVQKAAGNRLGTSVFFKTKRQANSLIADVIDAHDGIEVEVDTIDNMLQANGIASLDRLSVTINGAELEAIYGAERTLAASRQLRISLAGWYTRNGQRICDLVSPHLRAQGFQTAIGREGGMLAWK